MTTAQITPWIIGMATIAVALLAVTVAYAQWRTARQKLAIDLFDRRYRVYMALNDAIHARQAEIAEHVEQPEIAGPPSPALTSLWNTGFEAHFLFGKEVKDHLDVVSDRLRDLALARLALRDMSRPDLVERMNAFQAAVSQMNSVHRRLRELIEPYMMLDGVSSAGKRHLTEQQQATLSSTAKYLADRILPVV